MDLGVDWLVRETFHSSLELARETLVRIGVPDDVAIANVERFRRHDEALLARQYLIHDDEAALVQSAQEARAELESLFEADRGADGA
jgi:glutathione-regulated potassium-efflux system protein KefB